MGPFRDFGRSAKTSIMDMGKDTKEPVQSVQVFGRKKTATAVAYCKRGKGLVRVNGKPLEQVEPKPLQFKLKSPFFCWARIASAKLISGSVLRVVDVSHKSMLSDKPCPRPSSPTIKSTSMNRARRPSRTSSSNSTVLCL